MLLASMAERRILGRIKGGNNIRNN